MSGKSEFNPLEMLPWPEKTVTVKHRLHSGHSWPALGTIICTLGMWNKRDRLTRRQRTATNCVALRNRKPLMHLHHIEAKKKKKNHIEAFFCLFVCFSCLLHNVMLGQIHVSTFGLDKGLFGQNDFSTSLLPATLKKRNASSVSKNKACDVKAQRHVVF